MTWSHLLFENSFNTTKRLYNDEAMEVRANLKDQNCLNENPKPFRFHSIASR
jgi:hypothetical protein